MLFRNELPSASPEYNKTFSTKGEIARQVVDPWLQHKMLELEKIAGAELLVYAPDEKKTGVIVFMTTKKFVTDPAFATSVLEMLDRVAERTEKAAH